MPDSITYDEILARRTLPCVLRYQSAQPGDEPAMAASLADVSERRESAGFEQFSLLFRVAEAGAPRQGTYTIAFVDAPSWEVFLVPLRCEGADVVYEACFNRGARTAAP
jgi:hypothetical protein